VTGASRLLFLLVLGVLLASTQAGCSSTRRMAGDPTDGGAGGDDDDDDMGPPDDGGPPEDAGRSRPPECAPMDASGEGFCDLFLGWAWIPGDCVPLGGCDCVGADCDRLFDQEDECEAAFADCPAPDICGGFAGAPCAGDEFCDYLEGRCGAADGIGVCRPRPDLCTGPVDEVCGCDGEVYTSRCAANQAGTDIEEPDLCMTDF